MASVLEIAKQLNKDFKDNKLAVKADITPDYERMATGAFGLDYPLYGGLPLGRICTFAGLFHSGKSTAACIAMAAYQRKYPDKICVYADLEHALDIKFQSRMTGLDPDRMIYFSPTTLTGEQVLDALLEFQNEDGSFVHDKNDIKGDPMSTEQAMLALAAVENFDKGIYGIFDFTE